MMRELNKSGSVKKSSECMKLLLGIFVGSIFGFFLGVSTPTLSLSKMYFPSSLCPSVDLRNVQSKHSRLSTQSLFYAWSSLKRNKFNYRRPEEIVHKTIWAPTNPRGAERLPPGIVEPESDLYLRRLWGLPKEDLAVVPKYLVTFTVGYEQRYNIDAAVKKFSENFTIMLFHYDNRVTEWDEFEWSKRAIHVSASKQTKWWYAKRFLHPDIVAAYDYIFVWDEDLGVENFNGEEYIKLVRKYGLEISQPALDRRKATMWEMTRKRDDTEVHWLADEKQGWCQHPRLPPCGAFVEIMAIVFSRDAWRCIWHLVQNDLVHGWGIDFVLKNCVEPAEEKIGVIDAQWIAHLGVPSLGNQGQPENGRAAWEGVRARCLDEWRILRERMENAEKAYYKAMGSDPANSTALEVPAAGKKEGGT